MSRILSLHAAIKDRREYCIIHCDTNEAECQTINLSVDLFNFSCARFCMVYMNLDFDISTRF